MHFLLNTLRCLKSHIIILKFSQLQIETNKTYKEKKKLLTLIKLIECETSL